MAKILITGNGFDLFHHLPTKYGHFMSIMMTIGKFDFENEILFKDLFGRIFKEKFPIDYDLIIENYQVSDIRFDRFKIKELVELLKNNMWYKHFYKINEIDTWIDFESEIENVLIQISSLIRLVEKKQSGERFFKNDDLNIYIDFSEFDFCDKEVEGGVYINEKYINIRTGKFDSKEVLKKMVFALDEFTSIFNVYLSHVIVQFYDKYIGNLKIPIQSIDFFYSFNYTPTLEKIYNDKLNVVYLHGKTNIDDSIQNIVLGVDEIPVELTLNKAFEFSKYYQKILKRTNNTLLNIPNKDTEISEEYIFYIFGHSLDKSDKEYIENIFLFLEKDHTQSSGILVFYYDENDNKSKVKNLFSFIKKDVIVDLNASGRLDFIEINQTNLDNKFNKKIWQKYDENYLV